MYKVSAIVLVLILAPNFEVTPSLSKIIFLSSRLPLPSGRAPLGKVPEKSKLDSFSLIVVPADSIEALTSFSFVSIPEGEVVVSILIFPLISPFKNLPFISPSTMPSGTGVIVFEILSTTADIIAVFLI